MLSKVQQRLRLLPAYSSGFAIVVTRTRPPPVYQACPVHHMIGQIYFAT